ncbi:hypothetical protein [Acinetobacter faecalis]|uniref:hypothetical protein n=1 Tax=Acinetobacter faecalis TaxID=2665161 RepID=UPI002A90E90D|nr:hypothetical protein [Acinetobacter faecalis]MDY6450724.1 hypothetical protein [Acinetobacter faecalis]
MILFSVSEQLFYDSEFNYSVLPSDVIEISESKHLELLDSINSGCIVFSDLTHSDPRPSQFHEWTGTNWIDPRTEVEKLAYKRSQYPKLTRYQFMRGMLENGYKSADIEAQIMLIEDEYARELAMVGFKDAGNFVRTDPSFDVMRDILGKTDLEIDEFFELCMTF